MHLDPFTSGLFFRADGPRKNLLRLESALLGLILLDLLLVGTRVFSYPIFIRQPNSAFYLLEPVALLIVYAGIVLAVRRQSDPARRQTLRTVSRLGIVGGLLWSMSLAIETFASFSGPANLLSTAPFLMGGFALWGAVGFRSARRGHSVLSGVPAAVWCATITALLTTSFGFSISLVVLPRLAQQIAGSPEQVSSGWQDLQAFAIANQFDAGSSHMIGALIIGAILGAAGAVAAIVAQGDRSPEGAS